MKNFKQYITEEKSFSDEEVDEIAASIGVDFNKIDREQFKMGLSVEAEHDKDPDTDVVNNNTDIGKIALAHLRELPDYYTRLKKMEKNAGVSESVAQNLRVQIRFPNGEKQEMPLNELRGYASIHSDPFLYHELLENNTIKRGSLIYTLIKSNTYNRK